MLSALLLAAAAVVCAGFATQYARSFRGGLCDRHAARAADVTLFGNAETILALNDADIYASWRLARVNGCVASLCVIGATVIALTSR